MNFRRPNMCRDTDLISNGRVMLGFVILNLLPEGSLMAVDTLLRETQVDKRLRASIEIELEVMAFDPDFCYSFFYSSSLFF